MPHKKLEDRRTYGNAYYAKHRDRITAQRRAWAEAHPRKRRRKNFKNKMWCKDEDKPLWKKICRKWLHYVHDAPHLLIAAVSNIKNIADNDYFEKRKSTPEERYASHRAARSRWLSKPGVRDRQKAKRNFKRLKINGGMDRYYSDIQTRLIALLRGRLYRLTSAKNFRVSHSMLELLSCSIAQLRSHLESQFRPGMSWSNYGDDGIWQIHHIVACRRFEMRKPEHQRACFHWSNLAPLWTEINCKKDSHPSIPRLTEAEVVAMRQLQLSSRKLIPFPAQSGDENQPNKAASSLQNISAQLGP